MQRLHDLSIEKRAQLKVGMEEEQQRQDLTDSKLCNEQQRSVLREGGRGERGEEGGREGGRVEGREMIGRGL